MVKCELCGNKISQTFLGKIIGTEIKLKGSKKAHYVCNKCQKDNSDKNLKELLTNK